jgi:hypothetical protein
MKTKRLRVVHSRVVGDRWEEFASSVEKFDAQVANVSGDDVPASVSESASGAEKSTYLKGVAQHVDDVLESARNKSPAAKKRIGAAAKSLIEEAFKLLTPAGQAIAQYENTTKGAAEAYDDAKPALNKVYDKSKAFAGGVALFTAGNMILAALAIAAYLHFSKGR